MSKKFYELAELVGKRLEDVSLVEMMQDFDSDQVVLGVPIPWSYLTGDNGLRLLGVDKSWAEHLDHLRSPGSNPLEVYSPVIFNEDFGLISQDLEGSGVTRLAHQKVRTRNLTCDYVIKRGTMYPRALVLGVRIPDGPLSRLFFGSRYVPVR